MLRTPAPSGELTLEEQLERLNNDPEDQEQQRSSIALAELKKTTEMEALCDVLQNAGGQYYANAADCPQIQVLDL